MKKSDKTLLWFMRLAFIIAALTTLVLLFSCNGSSGGSDPVPPPVICPDVLRSELPNPDYVFVAGQLTMPETVWACSVDYYMGSCSGDPAVTCEHLTHKFCCFYWAPDHLSMFYHFQNNPTIPGSGWLGIESIAGDSVCDFSCPSQVGNPWPPSP